MHGVRYNVSMDSEREYELDLVLATGETKTATVYSLSDARAVELSKRLAQHWKALSAVLFCGDREIGEVSGCLTA